MNYRNSEHKILMQLIASLQLCDHLGDVGNDVHEALRQLNIDVPDNGEDSELRLFTWLAAEGVTTLYGTELVTEPIVEPEDEDEGEEEEDE